MGPGSVPKLLPGVRGELRGRPEPSLALPNPPARTRAEPGLNSSACGRSAEDAQPAMVGAVDDCRAVSGCVGRVRRAATKRPHTSVPPTSVASSAMPPAALGTVIDDYLAHGSVDLQNIRAVLVSQRSELLAERYYRGDTAAYAEIHSATKIVTSTLVGIALTKGDVKSLDQTLGELLPQHRSAMSKSSARTTVPQLLTMTGGWTAFYDADTARPKLVRRVLKAGPEVDPGTFVYSTLDRTCSARRWPKPPSSRRSPRRGMSCSTRSGSTANPRSRARSPNATTPTW